MTRGNSNNRLGERLRELAAESGPSISRRSQSAPTSSVWLARRYPWLKVRRFCGVDIKPQALAWAEALMDAYALAFGAGWLVVMKAGNRPDRHVRSARRGVNDLMAWLGKTWRREVPSSLPAAKAMKELSAWFRRLSLHDLTVGERKMPGYPGLDRIFRGCLSLRGYNGVRQSQVLHQFSRFGRAGPLPVKEQEVAAGKQHLEDLTSDFKCLRRHRQAARHFAERWASGKVSAGRFTFPTSRSATFGSTTKQGGLLAEIREAVKNLKTRRLTYKLANDIRSVCEGLPYTPFSESFPLFYGEAVGEQLFLPSWDDPEFLTLGPQQWEYLRAHLMGYVAMALRVHSLLRRKREKGDLPLARQVVILERGMKTRIVTPVVGCVSYISMFLNSFLLSLLETDPRLRSVSDISREASFKTTLGEVYRSVDMSRATDLMPHDLVECIVDGLVAGLGLPPFLADSLRLCTGPITMLADGGFHRTKRGIMMGVGTSWPILSLYNLWLWEGSWTGVSYNQVERRNRVRIVGDDLFGVAPLHVSDRYTSRLIATGGEPSFGKDYVSHFGGVILEELFIQEVLYPTVSVRMVQPRVQGKREETQPWAMGPQLALLTDRVGKPAWLIEYLHARYAEPIHKLRCAGIPPFLDRAFGGGGFPTNQSSDPLASLRPHWVRGLRCAMSQGSKLTYIAKLHGCWAERWYSTLTEGEKEYWREAQAEGMRDVLGIDVGESDQHTSAPGMVERVLAVASATQELLLPVLERKVRLTPLVVGKRLNKVYKDLNSLVPYPNLTDTTRSMRKGLVEFLEQAKRPVHKAGFLPIVDILSTHPSWA